MRKRTVLFVLTLIALLGLCGGCGEPKTPPEDVAKELLTSFVALDFERCNELTDPEAGVDFTGAFSQFDANETTVAKAMLQGVEIGDISVAYRTKQTAIISVEVKCFDMAKVSEQALDKYLEMYQIVWEIENLYGGFKPGDLPGGATETTDELWEQINAEILVDIFTSEDAPKTTKQVDIDLKVVDGEWKFAGKVDQIVEILCDY